MTGSRPTPPDSDSAASRAPQSAPPSQVLRSDRTGVKRRGTARTLLASVVAAGLIGLALPSQAFAASTNTSPSNGQPPASGAELSTASVDCEALSDLDLAATTIRSATTVPAGTLTFRGEPIGEHCLVTGAMNERVSEVDGQEYAIGFEIRLPQEWNGRFAYQGNGGLDGAVATALGTAGGSDSALQSGMAVISSDAGHSSAQNPTFGLDPQARLDYGYQAVGTLTPMAKELIEQAYGTAPHHSYMLGSSNGGRHTMVAASRYADEFDGFLAVAPGFNLPEAAVAQLWGAQQWDTVATTNDLASALTSDERVVVATAILERCDGLDGLEDGLVQDSSGCQDAFDVTRDVPTCQADRDGSCLDADQKAVLDTVFAGATTTAGELIYESFPFDPGLTQAGWADWKFNAPISRDSVAVGYIFSTPPYAPALNSLRDFVLSLDIDDAAERIDASSEMYPESAMDFMTPTDLAFTDLQREGGKMLVIHGASDGVFSMDDTTAWYDSMQAAYGGNASDFVRYFQVPGMGHTRGGPATDQNNSLTALVAWTEDGTAPDSLEAWVNPANAEIPTGWSAQRSRPLCAYPSVATYVTGDTEDASSFECRNETTEPVADFSDNPRGSTYYTPVRWLQLAGISSGYKDGTYRKFTDISRGESVAFLQRYLAPGYQVGAGGVSFSDVTAQTPHYTPITWAATSDPAVTVGYANGTFAPFRSVSRDEFVSFLYRAVDPEYTVPVGDGSPFADVSTSSSHFAAISWAASEGLVTGYKSGLYKPKDSINRAEVAKILYQYNNATK